MRWWIVKRILVAVGIVAALITGHYLAVLGILDTTGALVLVLVLVSMILALILYPFTGWKL